tara:strand:+ start:448 stop:657 length:210 start_codon:yes stop_codon:yes gene_type:complete
LFYRLHYIAGLYIDSLNGAGKPQAYQSGESKMTNRQKINRRKRQEFSMCIGASALAFTVAALLVMGVLV